MKNAQPSELQSVAEDVARKAGKFLLESMGSLCEEDIGYKGHIDLVTRMDRESEEIIVKEIRSRYPEHGILAEESERVDSRSGYLWCIDPLDGTTNYVHSFPLFCVSIGVCKDNVPIAGAVFAPYLNEMFAAHAGGGAFLNGKQVRVSKTSRVTDAMFCTGFASMRSPEAPDNILNFVRMLRLAQGVRRGGSAALELAWLACGRLDGFWELNLSPWDVAAGSLIVQEAGGRVTDMAGGPKWLFGRSIIASNGALHQELVDRIDSEERFVPGPRR